MNFLPALIGALIMAESGNNPKAIGDGGKAVGILQIHKICVEDVNRIYATDFVWPRDAQDPITAKEICRLYLTHYLKSVLNPAPSDAARIWNGGPSGHLKQQTINYWQKVQPLYAQQCAIRSQSRLIARN